MPTPLMGPMDTVTEVEVQPLHHMVTRQQEFGLIFWP